MTDDLDAAWAAAMAGALVGAERAPARSADLLELPVSGDVGADLLARLGALAAFRLAGAGLAPDHLAPFPPLDAPGPECPAAAGGRLARLLAEGGSAADPLVSEWCGLAAERGFRAPPELWPMLEMRASSPAGAAAVMPVAGHEVAWLRRAFAGEAEVPAAPEAAGDWTLGTLTERRRLFAALRGADPDGVRDALASAFRSEKAEARAALVEALEEGLGEADEPFLEACLDDRSVTVRGAAQRLLLRLPESRFADRMADRAAAALRVTETKRLLGGAPRALAVELPEASPELARDGLEATRSAGDGAGPHADLLRQIVASAPLRAFAGHPPEAWLALAAESEWEAPLLAGLFDAVRRERDPAWIAASLAWLEARCGRRGADAAKDRAAVAALGSMLALLPDEEFEARVGTAMSSNGVDLALRLVDGGVRRHSPAFSRTVLTSMASLIRGGGAARDALRDGSAVRTLAFRLDPGAASEAARLAESMPEEVDARLHRALAALAETLAQRAAMRREFDA